MRAAAAVVVMVATVAVAACGPKARPVAVAEEPGGGSGTGTGTGTGAGAGADAGVVEEPKDPLAAAVERIVTLYEQIATLPPTGSCRDAAASIDRWTGERAAALVQVRDAAQGGQAALVDGLFHDASARLAAAVKAIDELATRCASEPTLVAALSRLSTETGR